MLVVFLFAPRLIGGGHFRRSGQQQHNWRAPSEKSCCCRGARQDRRRCGGFGGRGVAAWTDWRMTTAATLSCHRESLLRLCGVVLLVPFGGF